MRRLPVRVRRASAADAAALSALYRGVRRWLLARGNPQWKDEPFAAASLLRALRTQPILVATRHGRIVGAVQASWRDPVFWPDRPLADALYVSRLAVARRAAGQGVAEALLLAVTRLARRRRRSCLRLDCAPLEALARIYGRLGFVLIDASALGGYRVFRFERRLVRQVNRPCAPGRPRSGRAAPSCRPCRPR